MSLQDLLLANTDEMKDSIKKTISREKDKERSRIKSGKKVHLTVNESNKDMDKVWDTFKRDLDTSGNFDSETEKMFKFHNDINLSWEELIKPDLNCDDIQKKKQRVERFLSEIKRYEYIEQKEVNFRYARNKYKNKTIADTVHKILNIFAFVRIYYFKKV